MMNRSVAGSIRERTAWHDEMIARSPLLRMVACIAAILDTAIVDVGRNVVTCSRDGTARLWDVGRQAELYAWSDLGGEVNCCEIAVTDSCVHLGTADTAPRNVFVCW